MDDTWAVSSWNAPHHSPRAHAAGLDEINSFFDSAPASPAISASATTAEQLPADTAASRPPAAAEAGDEVLLEPVSSQSLLPPAPQPSCEFSALLADIEQVEATAAQAEPSLRLGGVAYNAMASMPPTLTFSQHRPEQQLRPYNAMATQTFARHGAEQQQRPYNVWASLRPPMETLPPHYFDEPAVPFNYMATYAFNQPPPLTNEQPRPRPTLLPSPMPDIALLPDGTIDAPVKEPRNAFKYSMFEEMRSEEEYGDLPRQDQPLALDFGMNAHGVVHNVLNTHTFGAETGQEQFQAPYVQHANDRHLLAGYGEAQLHDDELGEQEISRPMLEHEMLEREMNGPWQDNNGLGHELERQEHVESAEEEQARRTATANLEEMLAAMQEANVAGTGFEGGHTQDDAVAYLLKVAKKRERAGSIRDSMAVPEAKKAKTPDSAQADVEDSMYAKKLLFATSAHSQQVGKTWAQGMMAEQRPAGVTTAGLLSSPLSDTTDADAPGSPDEEYLAAQANRTSSKTTPASKPTGRDRVGKKQVEALVSDTMHIALKLSPGPVKTRQQKKAQDDLKPNASAAVKRRRSGK